MSWIEECLPRQFGRTTFEMKYFVSKKIIFSKRLLSRTDELG